MLMNVMTTNLAHTAGLNPKGFRQIRQGKKDLRNASRGIVDGDLVFKYPDLPAPEKVHCQKLPNRGAEYAGSWEPGSQALFVKR